MIKRLMLFATILVSLSSVGQVTINVQLPPAGMIQKDQLWSLVMVNNSSETIETRITLDLQDAVTGQTILSAGSRPFTMGKGIKVINIKDVQPVQYNYQAAEITGAFIPLGTYIACYRVSRIGQKGEPLGDECVRLTISPMSPPMLTTPADRSVLQTPYPVFTWLPPMPVDMFTNLGYEIAVAEVLPGQTATEAILYNTPVYINHSLRIPVENYPSTFSKLKQGQEYAWQVTARNGLNYAAQTEVWSFVLQAPDSAEVVTTGNAYILLKNDRDRAGISLVSEDLLHVKYYSFDKAHETTIRISGNDGKLVQEVKQKLVYGDNFLQVKLNNQYQAGTIYNVEITDQQKNIHSTRFSIK